MSAIPLSITGLRPINRVPPILPGAVGSVGDVLMSSRLKSSLPGDVRMESYHSGDLENDYGSNVSDGTRLSYKSGGGPARTYDSNWKPGRGFKVARGWYFQDIRAPDTLHEPELGPMPQYSWRNRISSVKNQLKTGNLFRGVGINAPTGPPRGGQVPRVTDIVTEPEVGQVGTNYTINGRDNAISLNGTFRDRTNYQDFVGVGSRLGQRRKL
jgi:hypothetical protein